MSLQVAIVTVRIYAPTTSQGLHDWQGQLRLPHPSLAPQWRERGVAEAPTVRLALQRRRTEVARDVPLPHPQGLGLG